MRGRVSSLILALLTVVAVGFLTVGCAGAVKPAASTSNPNPISPAVMTSPSNQTVTAGQTASFAVTATGTAPLSYQWQKNGAIIAGATLASYTTPPTTGADNGATFMVVVSNSGGNASSNPATLTVNPAGTAPTITAEPANQTVNAGQTATFSVVATGTAPLNYQWQKNGVSIAGATSASYTTPVTTTADSGSPFQVVVSNSVGSAQSNPATLTVNAAAVAPTITTQPVNQTVTAGQTATFAVVAAGSAPLNYQWQKNGASIAGATSASYTTPATTTAESGATFLVVVSNSGGSAQSNPATLTVNAASVAPTITTQPANQAVTTGQTATFSVAATGTAPLSYQWQKNAVNISGATSSSYTTPATALSDDGATFKVVVSNARGSVTSNAATLSVTPAAVAPTIITQPANQTVTAGQTATFAVVAAGTAPLGYQWQKNGANIAGATSATYTTPSTAVADSGSTFGVVVSNTAGSITSAAATLTVNPAPVAPTLSAQPSSQTVTAGQTVTFSVVASGTAPLSYQWQKNAADISGATSSSYTTPATAVADSGSTFRVVVSNVAGSITSATATLTVNPPPVAPAITTQPANKTVTAGQTATFAVVATGTAPLSYQWQKDGAAISGATSTSYTTPATTTSDSGATFRVVVTNSAGSATSNSATLTVNPAQVAPSITTQPASQTVSAGQTATFTVAASGTAPLSYQWQKNGSDISGATSSSYTTPATATSDNGATFRVMVSNSIGSVTSNSATLTVTSGSAIATITVLTTTPGQAIPSNFGGISTFDIQDVDDLMGDSSKGTNPIYRQLIKNLIFPGQQFVITSEDDDGPGSVTTAPTPTQVTGFGQFYTDMKNSGHSVQLYPGVPACRGNETLAKNYAQSWINNMPAGSLSGMVIGNEPDGPCGISYSTYLSHFQTWTSAINAMPGGSGVKFIGPQFGGQLPWVDTGSDLNPFINSEAGILAAAGQHWYALNGCTGSPTLSGLLASSAATNASSILLPHVTTAHNNGTTLRISEMNSIDCGGRSGISDTMAAALWVMDGMFNLANVGVDGVNIFSDEGDNYDLFGFTTTSAPYHVSFIRPEYYGVLVFQQATQNGAKLIPLTLSTSSNISAWATIDANNTVRVLVINKDQSASGDVSVVLTGFANGTLSRLAAPSVSSKTGVTWAGQTFDGSPDGTLQGILSTTTVTPTFGVYTCTIAPTSAALLTINP
jgi:hypothetical protein